MNNRKKLKNKRDQKFVEKKGAFNRLSDDSSSDGDLQPVNNFHQQKAKAFQDAEHRNE